MIHPAILNDDPYVALDVLLACTVTVVVPSQVTPISMPDKIVPTLKGLEELR